MTTVKIEPPQTYSRLFRPWDTTKSRQNETSAEQEYNNSAESLLKNFEVNKSVFYGSVPMIHGDHLALQAQMDYPCFSSFPSSNNVHISMSYFGLDPVGANLMEQEYARVISEDAHMKAINARKQRPKKFKCPHCNVAFSNNGQLKGHIRIHTGERPYKCDIESCGKTFTRNEELTRHKRIHTGLRPFGCALCGKKFGRRDHLKKHAKTHLPQERHLESTLFVPIYPYLYGY